MPAGSLSQENTQPSSGHSLRLRAVSPANNFKQRGTLSSTRALIQFRHVHAQLNIQKAT